jgi:hypothetical protein
LIDFSCKKVRENAEFLKKITKNAFFFVDKVIFPF